MWERLIASWQPRGVTEAARSVSLLYVLGGTLIALESSVIPSPHFPRAYAWVPWLIAGYFVVAGLVLWWLGDRTPRVAWPFLVMLPAFLITLLAVGSHDGSAASQLAFCWPVLLSSYHFRPVAARIVAAQVVACEVVVVVVLDPSSVVAEDAVGVPLILVAIMVTLTFARDRMDSAMRSLRHEALHDAVTGLLGRRAYDSDLGRLADDEPVSLIVVDIDDFKLVNDSYGHRTGDDVLRVVASCLVANRRQHDTAYRLGGDELAVLLRGCSGEHAMVRAEAIRCAVLSAPALLLSKDDVRTPARVTVSLGVASCPEHARRPRDLLEVADAAMYAAKNGGRNQVASAPAA